MASTPLEKLRQSYQDIEDKRKQATKLLLIEPKTVKEEAYVTHYVAKYAKEIQELSNSILDVINNNGIEKVQNPLEAFNQALEERITFHSQVVDKPVAAVKEEKEDKGLHGKTMNDIIYDIQGSPHLNLFYDNARFQEWRRQFQEEKERRRNKKKKKTVISETDEALTKFSGEECYGMFLDLNELHSQYINITKTSISYLEFLEILQKSNDFSNLPKSEQTEKFIENLVSYLMGFLERAQPFFPLTENVENIINQFNKTYADKKSQQKFYCEYCNRDLKTEERFKVHQTEKSHLRKVQKIENTPGGLEEVVRMRTERNRAVEQNSFLAIQLLQILKSVLEATIENTKRKQTVTAATIEAERDLDAPITFEENDSEDEEQFVNPKGLPLGWDGKPIPMWLYKLHGLSVEYKCEICGNRSYWGIAAFERHFVEATHVSHLKALGIPNTKHFLYITKINEAVNLFKKIKGTLKEEVWQKGQEEIEAADGTVVPLKLYEDCVRQGLIKPRSK
ncbi:Zinc finger, C2H2 type family protein [Trichomonas vaginalis G3]|uniref:Zinc finger, C2H2 type family protein n=1 Tax=Trichomonas vaginalis (strain ATCC PRA-98 / G3) TaxID=412133 RepID=A2DYJ8_TRIV3|nr:splicing factor 3A subunit 3 family [Trichomonas vaginalis G3]EAY14533.1 Zinc finger, C2H2 type family protein [Trichomonas vaginalis G3]KAI5529294.1 splicing factor 3A subunit 3 family [Trichomonas vaginalis G3]|eukprot:XP_001326756.1 Zinc finger, C2H2 type family protein [Trichomonas vaginalis G3]